MAEDEEALQSMRFDLSQIANSWTSDFSAITSNYRPRFHIQSSRYRPPSDAWNFTHHLLSVALKLSGTRAHIDSNSNTGWMLISECLPWSWSVWMMKEVPKPVRDSINCAVHSLGNSSSFFRCKCLFFSFNKQSHLEMESISTRSSKIGGMINCEFV